MHFKQKIIFVLHHKKRPHEHVKKHNFDLKFIKIFIILTNFLCWIFIKKLYKVKYSQIFNICVPFMSVTFAKICSFLCSPCLPTCPWVCDGLFRADLNKSPQRYNSTLTNCEPNKAFPACKCAPHLIFHFNAELNLLNVCGKM